MSMTKILIIISAFLTGIAFYIVLNQVLSGQITVFRCFMPEENITSFSVQNIKLIWQGELQRYRTSLQIGQLDKEKLNRELGFDFNIYPLALSYNKSYAEDPVKSLEIKGFKEIECPENPLRYLIGIEDEG